MDLRWNVGSLGMWEVGFLGRCGMMAVSLVGEVLIRVFGYNRILSLNCRNGWLGWIGLRDMLKCKGRYQTKTTQGFQLQPFGPFALSAGRPEQPIFLKVVTDICKTESIAFFGQFSTCAGRSNFFSY